MRYAVNMQPFAGGKTEMADDTSGDDSTCHPRHWQSLQEDWFILSRNDSIEGILVGDDTIHT